MGIINDAKQKGNVLNFANIQLIMTLYYLLNESVWWKEEQD